MTAWLVLAVGEERQHGGNDGYDDDPSSRYEWDSTVPHAAEIAKGDVIAVWDKRALLGVSVIERIETWPHTKIVRRCPSCKKSEIKKRRNTQPLFRCGGCSHTFDEPAELQKEVTAYRSRHSVGWVDLPNVLDGPALRAVCKAPKSQQSFRMLRWDKFTRAVAERGQLGALRIVEETATKIAGGRGNRIVRVRIGQSKFRARLLEKYGPVCAFTGPAPLACLDAAHLYSYASVEEHHDDGGVLLRRDIHTLFDQGLLAVEPTTGRIDVAADLASYQLYASLHGKPLHCALRSSQKKWLSAHWAEHRAAFGPDRP
jgi:ribosomal protein L37AE/L43A